MSTNFNKIIILFFFSVMMGSCDKAVKIEKVIKVKEIESTRETNIKQVSYFLEEFTELHKVDIINWNKFPYQPDVRFRIAHGNNQIWLKFYVQEKELLAKNTKTNSATHRDSCVEFFLDILQDGNYYNFEFNCIGTTHLAYGPDRMNRKFIDPKVINEKVQTESSLGDEPFDLKTGRFSWEMTAIIPMDVLTHTNNIQLKGIKANANFYKCGDNTSTPHYLSWNPVGTEAPDFHQPIFFGKLVFE